jgi:hypothetical protein
MSDTNSTGNLRKHARLCWGEEALKAAEEAKDVNDARELVVKSILKSGSITALFERKNKKKVTYSNRQHTRTETRLVQTSHINKLADVLLQD